ncbi:19507_t:CDS:2, partial [Rhizophagus irregularis]
MGVYSGGKNSNSISSEEELEASNRIKYLSDTKHKIREVLFYCSTVYQCRKQAISNYFAWPGDPVPQECTLCDNCIRRVTDNPVYIDVQSDVLKMLEIINVTTKMHQQITRNNIVDVFRRSQAKEVKSQFEDALLLLDDLILRKIVEKDIILNRSSTGQTCTCSVFIFGLAEDAL